MIFGGTNVPPKIAASVGTGWSRSTSVCLGSVLIRIGVFFHRSSGLNGTPSVKHGTVRLDRKRLVNGPDQTVQRPSASTIAFGHAATVRLDPPNASFTAAPIIVAVSGRNGTAAQDVSRGAPPENPAIMILAPCFIDSTSAGTSARRQRPPAAPVPPAGMVPSARWPAVR